MGYVVYMIPRNKPFIHRKLHFSASFRRFCACHAAGMTAAAKAGTGARWRGLHARQPMLGFEGTEIKR